MLFCTSIGLVVNLFKSLFRISVDYDLVVIGMSAYAHKLVKLASQRKARVVWVWDQVNDSYLNIDQVIHILQLLKTKISDRPKPERLKLFAKQIPSILQDFCQEEIREILQKNGVDVIVGACKFQSKEQNSYILEVSETSLSALSRESSQSRLSSRAYAITHDTPTPLRKVFGLAEHNYITAPQLLHLQDLPNSIAVLGDDAHACAIAQALNFLGVHTSLITNNSHVLPNIDVAIARTLQAQLEAEGVEVYTSTQVTAVSKIEQDRSRIWLNNTTIECDRLLVPLASKEFDYPSDRHIYQCRSDQDIAKILNQTLQTSFWQSASMPTVPEITSISTTPPLAQIGMTEVLARLKYKQVYVLDSYVENGLCKIIGDRQGQILGASMFGDRAQLVIEAIAIAMQGKAKIQDIGVLQELQITEQWEKLHQTHAQKAKLKEWFTFRRDWNI
ncbi:FAD-dependent oxidoreductase [Pseudanabaena minima]|uniref:FAD-dependent oxidoreductase n=1 Tax=Pseudanabaena minima TaxID=890415 RepID=UPI003DA9F220